MSEQSPEERDIGTVLAVPEDEREQVDPNPADVGEENDDAGADLSHVPEGEWVDLSSSDDEEPVGADEPNDPGEEPDLMPEEQT